MKWEQQHKSHLKRGHVGWIEKISLPLEADWGLLEIPEDYRLDLEK